MLSAAADLCLQALYCLIGVGVDPKCNYAHQEYLWSGGPQGTDALHGRRKHLASPTTFLWIQHLYTHTHKEKFSKRQKITNIGHNFPTTAGERAARGFSKENHEVNLHCAAAEFWFTLSEWLMTSKCCGCEARHTSQSLRSAHPTSLHLGFFEARSWTRSLLILSSEVVAFTTVSSKLTQLSDPDTICEADSLPALRCLLISGSLEFLEGTAAASSRRNEAEPADRGQMVRDRRSQVKPQTLTHCTCAPVTQVAPRERGSYKYWTSSNFSAKATRTEFVIVNLKANTI